MGVLAFLFPPKPQEVETRASMSGFTAELMSARAS